MKNLLLVDFSNMLYRAVFTNRALTHKKKFTGGIYGFFNMLSSTVTRYQIDRVVICKDVKPYRRTAFFKAYKHGRRVGMNENDIIRISVARKQINDFVRQFGFPQGKKTGYEADDFIGRFCKVKRKKFDRIFVMSNDSDFYQLLDSVNVFLVGTKGLYGQAQFKKDYPTLSPEDWPRVLALMGSHNGVPGIDGIGPKKAAKLVADGVTNEEIYEKFGHLPKHIELRQNLAKFPFPLAEPLPLPRVEPIDYDAQKFEEVCIRYGIKFKDEFHNAFVLLSS